MVLRNLTWPASVLARKGGRRTKRRSSGSILLNFCTRWPVWTSVV